MGRPRKGKEEDIYLEREEKSTRKGKTVWDKEGKRFSGKV